MRTVSPQTGHAKRSTGVVRKFHFTKAHLEALQPEPKRYRVRDAATRGLTLTVMPTGARVFYFYGRMGGTMPESIRIGPFPEVGIEQARRRARGLIGAIATGENPAQARRQQRGELTFGELYRTFEAWADANLRLSTREDYKRWHRLYLKPWDNRTLREITRQDVAALHQRIGRKAPVQANRCATFVGRLFNFARERFDHEQPSPAAGVRKHREKSRSRFLEPDEVPVFWAAVEAEPDEDWRDFWKLALLTGARRGNLQRMAWADLDLKRGTWHISDTESKNHRELHVVLVPQAIEVLTARRDRIKGEKPKYVFPGCGKTGHVTQVKSPWSRLMKSAGIEGLRFHDLRRTIGSWQAMTGASLPVIGRSLGHQSQQATAIYARLSDEPVRESMSKAVAAFMAAANKTTEGNGNAAQKAS